MLDTTRRVATPEGIELTLRLAGPVPRALAWAIDFALRVRFEALLRLAIDEIRRARSSAGTLWIHLAFDAFLMLGTGVVPGGDGPQRAGERQQSRASAVLVPAAGVLVDALR